MRALESLVPEGAPIVSMPPFTAKLPPESSIVLLLRHQVGFFRAFQDDVFKTVSMVDR